MPLIEQSEASRLLEPWEPDITRCFRSAWKRFSEIHDESMRARLDARTRASWIRDQVIADITDLAEEHDELRVTEYANLFCLVVSDRVAVRFKKLDAENLTRNNETDQVRRFKSQQQLDGFPEVAHLEAGYVLDHLETDILRVSIVCPNGSKSNYWDYPIYGDAENVIVDMFSEDRRARSDRYTLPDDKTQSVEADETES